MKAETDALRRRIEELEAELERIRLSQADLDGSDTLTYVQEMEGRLLASARRSQQFLQSVLNTAGNNIASYEAIRNVAGKIVDFRIVYTNENTFAQVSTHGESIIGRRCSEVYPSIFGNGIFEKLVKCIETGRPDHYQIDITKDGETHWFDASIEKFDDSVTVTARNITEELRSALRLKDLNRRLKIQNSIFKHSEENAKIGSYAWNVATDELECSDNLYRLIGYQPQEFAPSFEQFLSFLHPDDRHQAIRDGIRAYETQVIVHNTYRVITKTGEIKHFRLSGNFIWEGDNLLMIGALQDVTKDIELSDALQKKNMELRRNNEELASFSYVASHDLQEPLRKIRAFSSRIMEKEAETFSDNARDYFARIVAASSRMQKLIEALLSYSGTSGINFHFVETDLNIILDEVKSDLEELIIGKEGVVEVDPLPKLPVIPIQFHQLMQNLIGNGIKYSSPDRKPVVRVSCSVEEDQQGSFCKITVTDNGIGFDQRYENRIFDLFQRLHGKNEYEGTGIGLAICKKIAQNHHGFITAEGTPGVGSAFHVFIPREAASA